MSGLLIEENARLTESGVYIAFVILEAVTKKDRVSIFDMYEIIKKKIEFVNYANVMDALLFLRMLGLIKFNAPYFSKV